MLEEMQWEPRNVQIVMTEDETGVYLSLHNQTGQFLEAGPDESVVPAIPSSLEDDTAASVSIELQQLHQDNNKLRKRTAAITEQVSAVNEKLGKLQVRVRDLWHMSCQQVEDHDTVIADKDAEIGHLYYIG